MTPPCAAAHRFSPLGYLSHLLLLRGGASSPKSFTYRVARLLVLLAYFYLGVLVLLLFLENRLLYHPYTVADQWESPPPRIQVRDVDLTAADGTRLHAWWSIPDGWRPDDGAVLLCHGNAGNVSFWGWEMADWVTVRKQAVLAFDYPGYGKCDGAPSEAGCYAAADAAYEFLTQTQQVPGKRVLLYGESLGGAVAVDVASRRPHRALILASTFTSFPDLAQEKYPFFPGRWLVRNQFRSAEKLRNCPGPVFIGHGTDDTLIPFGHGERLFAAANGPKEFVTMQGIGHEAPTAEFFERCMRFLEECDKEATPPTTGGN